MNEEKCRCLFPAVVWDKEICEATGGECIPEIFGEGPSPLPETEGLPPGYPYPSGGREMPLGGNCGPEIQRVMSVPFGFDAECVQVLEDPDRRPFIWEW